MCELHTTQSLLADLPGSEWEESPEKMDLISGYKIGLASFTAENPQMIVVTTRYFFSLSYEIQRQAMEIRL